MTPVVVPVVLGGGDAYLIAGIVGQLAKQKSEQQSEGTRQTKHKELT
jgi:hypothetical protein